MLRNRTLDHFYWACWKVRCKANWKKFKFGLNIPSTSLATQIWYYWGIQKGKALTSGWRASLKKRLCLSSLAPIGDCVSVFISNREEKCDVTLPWYQNFWIATIGSFSNDDGDGNENGKKVIDLYWQNNFARASRFFVHFLAVVTRLRRETS